MRLSRVVIRNFRSFQHLDVPISETTTCVIGENNTGKTNFLHAIRLCIDSGLSSTFRSLIARDIHAGIDVSHPNQVLIGLEITDFDGKVNEEALVGAWQFEPGRARLIYRFRPKKNVREDLETEEIIPGELTLEDYHWKLLPVVIQRTTLPVLLGTRMLAPLFALATYNPFSSYICQP